MAEVFLHSGIVFIGDGHMSELAWKSRPNAKWDARESLASILSAESGGAGTVVFCGDCFDSRRPSPSEIAAMRDCVGSSGMRALHVQGNHDKCRGVGWMELIGSESLHNRRVEAGGVALSGVDHSGRDELDEALAGICSAGPLDVLVLHQALAEAGNREPGCISKADIPQCVRMGMVVGHTHSPLCVQDSEGRWLVSPGCSHRRKVDEPPGSYALLLNGVFELKQSPWGRELLSLTAEQASAFTEAPDGPPAMARVSGSDHGALALGCSRLAKLGMLVFPRLEPPQGPARATIDVGGLCRLDDALAGLSPTPETARFLLEACSEGVCAVDRLSVDMRSERSELERRLSDAQAARNAGVQSGRP